MTTKNVNNFKEKTFRDIFRQLHTQEYKATKKQIVRLQLNEKKSNESLQWVKATEKAMRMEVGFREVG